MNPWPKQREEREKADDEGSIGVGRKERRMVSMLEGGREPDGK